MVKINGVKAKLTNEEILKKNSSPTMNQILDKMENNFHDIEARAQNTQSANFSANPFQGIQNENVNDAVNTMNTSQNASGSILGDNNILLTLLPLLSSGKDKVNLFGADSPILKEIIKKTNNPMLQKILELIPALTKPKVSKQNEEKLEEKNQTKIDSYIKTDDYNVT